MLFIQHMLHTLPIRPLKVNQQKVEIVD